ncbi:sulfotransferase family protein [Salibacterium aidingense]|uniref:sulfotransferase family protein n=1 Tax=Salibacterium aidingense TaxID=384933 RepID=UPI003BBA25F7
MKNWMRNSKYELFFHNIYNIINYVKGNNKVYKLQSDYYQSTPFFIVGSGRSGNTLLRSMLIGERENGIVIPPESYVLGNVVKKYHKMARVNNIKWEDLCAVVTSTFTNHQEFKLWGLDDRDIEKSLLEIPRDHRSLDQMIIRIYKLYGESLGIDTKMWGDKTPLNVFNLNVINKTFPEAKFIHLIRDGRDVASSYVKSGLYSDITEACERWNQSLHHVNKFSKYKSSNKIMDIKYEDLIYHPEDELKRICDFLNISFSDSMLNRDTQINLGDVEGLSHHENVKNPINSSSIGKWKKDLDSSDQQKVNDLCYQNLLRYGYA